jgi:hypothetical protein
MSALGSPGLRGSGRGWDYGAKRYHGKRLPQQPHRLNFPRPEAFRNAAPYACARATVNRFTNAVCKIFGCDAEFDCTQTLMPFRKS